MKLNDHTDCSIHKLPKSVLNFLQSQITISSFEAAIRELLQNSLDADANQVKIKLDLRSLSICIEDNGCGMRYEELDKVGKRYFTSKIDLLEELKYNKTFGFRGEALHSIGNISHLSIISKHESNSQAFKLKEVKGNLLPNVYKFEEESYNYLEDHFKFGSFLQSGTIIKATNVFANIPVRRNQIFKLPEHKLIENIKLVILQSLMGRANAKVILMKLDVPSSTFQEIVSVERNLESDLQARYATIFTSIYGQSLLSEYEILEANYQNYRLDGIIGLYPSQSKEFQYIFINKRPLLISNEDSKHLNKIFIGTNFGGVLKSAKSNKNVSPKVSPRKQYTSKSFSRFPVFIVNIQCPVIVEDLFQDPSKGIYYSDHLKLILSMVRNVFSSFLKSQGYEYITKDLSASPSPSPSPKRQKKDKYPLKQNASLITTLNSSSAGNFLKPIVYTHDIATPKPFTDNILRTNIQNPSINDSQRMFNTENKSNQSMIHSEVENHDLQETNINKGDLINGNYRIIRQLDRKFMLLVMPSTDKASHTKFPTLIAVDQHACDERIRVESLLKEFILMLLNKSLDIELDKPFIFSVSNRENTLFKSYLLNFESLGIKYVINKEYELFITHLPHILIEKVGTDADFLKSCLLQHLFDLEYNKKKVDISNLTPENWFQNIVQMPQVIIDSINSKACRSAIMFGDKLTIEEMLYLIKSLSTCHQPFQCAHGRPSMVPLANIS